MPPIPCVMAILCSITRGVSWHIITESKHIFWYLLNRVYEISSYAKAATLFQEALDLAQVTQSSQKSWATTYINLGTCFRKLKYDVQSLVRHDLTTYLCRRFDEARITYQKVLELDPRHSIALGFLGMVHHLMGHLDRAIVKYHEASIISPGHVMLIVKSSRRSALTLSTPISSSC